MVKENTKVLSACVFFALAFWPWPMPGTVFKRSDTATNRCQTFNAWLGKQKSEKIAIRNVAAGTWRSKGKDVFKKNLRSVRGKIEMESVPGKSVSCIHKMFTDLDYNLILRYLKNLSIFTFLKR